MTRHRKPAAFRLDDPDVVVAPATADMPTPARGGAVLVTPAPEAALPIAQGPARPARRKFPLATISEKTVLRSRNSR